jgi:hypothetical protein
VAVILLAMASSIRRAATRKYGSAISRLDAAAVSFFDAAGYHPQNNIVLVAAALGRQHDVLWGHESPRRPLVHALKCSWQCSWRRQRQREKQNSAKLKCK